MSGKTLMMTKEGSTIIVKFITPGAGVLMLGRGKCHLSEYVLSSTQSIYTTLIAIVLRKYNAAFLCHCCCCRHAYMSPSDKKSV